MKKKLNLEMGEVYEIVWLDHDQLESKGSEAAVHTEESCMVSYGKYMGKRKVKGRFLHVFAYNFEQENSSNNDNMRIWGTLIVKASKMTEEKGE